jgi:tetratricopeptide (TPR) repeat protein
MGRASRTLGRDREAEDAFREAVRWDSTRVEDRDELARIALADGRPDEALAHVDAALRLGADTPERRALRGRVLAAAGRLPEARAEIGRALVRDPDSPEVRIARLAVRLRADSAATARVEAEDLVRRFPGQADPLFARADTRVALGDSSGAREDLRAGLALEPRRPRARLALADLLRAAGEDAAAADEYRRVLEDNPRNAVALEGLGACALAAGDPTGAEAAFRQAIATDPEHAPAWLGLGRFLARTDRPDSAIVVFRKARARAALDDALWEECGLELGETYLALGEAGNALDVVDGLLERNPDSERARSLRGRALAAGGGGSGSGETLEKLATRPEATRDEVLAYGRWLLERSDPARAAELVDEWISARGPDPDARTLRAEALAALGRTEEAEIELHDVLAGDRPVESARLALARLYLAEGRWPDALFHAREGARIDPSEPAFLEVTGRASMESGRPHDARVAFEAQRELRPDEPDAELNLGTLEMRLARPAEAVKHFRRAGELAPRAWLPRFSLALALAADDRPREAIATYREVLAIDERIAEAHNNLAWLLADLDLDPILAEVHARRAAELAPRSPDVLGTLGWAQYKNRLFDEAAATLAEASRRRPDDPMKHWMLAEVELARGRPGEARREAEAALALDPAFPRADRARDLLSRLDR